MNMTKSESKEILLCLAVDKNTKIGSHFLSKWEIRNLSYEICLFIFIKYSVILGRNIF